MKKGPGSVQSLTAWLTHTLLVVEVYIKSATSLIIALRIVM